MLAAIAAYTRPVGFYWGYSLPVIVFFGALFQHENKTYSATFAAKHAILSFICLSILLAPWQTRNYLTFGYYDFTSNKGLYLRDNLLSLYQADNMSLNDANLTFDKKFADYCLSMKTPCDSDNPFFISKAMSDFAISDLKQTNPTLIAKTGLKSLIMLAFPPGTGLFREAWGMSNLNIGGVSSSKGFAGITEAATVLLNNTSQFYLAFFGLSLAFSVTIKLMATTGIFLLVKTESARLSFFILLSTILLAASYIFLGQPKFRIPLEPILTYLAILGLHRQYEVWPSKFGKVLFKRNKN